MAKKIVLITGVTRGLGRAMVDEFVRLGHTVLGCGRSKAGIEQLRRHVGPPHDFAVVDVASDDEVKAWAGRLLGSHGPPDLVLNNAGVINKNAPLWEISAQEFSQVHRRKHQRHRQCHPPLCAGDDQAQAWRHREFQFRLGAVHGRGGRAVLREQVGD